jgi:transcriptional regulator with XRE-family HTH domain
VDDIRLGARVRALRHRLGLRQRDLADRAGVTQDDVSRIERGRLAAMPSAKVRRVGAALEADVTINLRWRGGDLDRLLDEGHASLVGRVIEVLQAFGWEVRAEVSYSEYGERGSIDILAWHSSTRTLLAVEVKTDLVSLEETLRKHDEKTRLAPKVAREHFGWHAALASRLLVLPDLSTQRRRVERHDPVLRVACPVRGLAVRGWLKAPTERISGLMFVRPARPGAIARRRVRCRKAA